MLLVHYCVNNRQIVEFTVDKANCYLWGFFFNGEMWTYLESNGTLLSIAIAKNIMNRQQMLVLVATFRRTYATN